MNAIATSLLSFVLLVMTQSVWAQAADSFSLELGKGNKTELARVGAQWDWQQRWRQSHGTHIGGYWGLNLGYWRGGRYLNTPLKRQNFYTIGVTPVLRMQRDDLLGWYGELGIGVNLLSRDYRNNGRRLSTHFQFGDHLGFGYVFANKMDISLRFQHFSNGGIKEPNDGVNFSILRISYPL